jgi:hypothetical protein
MKGHPDYERVVEEDVVVVVAVEEPKKLGRPKKTETTAEVA